MMKWHSLDQNLKKKSKDLNTKCLHKTDFFFARSADMLTIRTHTQRERDIIRLTIRKTVKKLNLNKLTINLGIFKMRTHAGDGILYGLFRPTTKNQLLSGFF